MTKLLTPKGILGYTSVRIAQGFKGSEENKKFSAQLILRGKDATDFVDLLEKEYAKLHAEEVERQRMKGGSARFPAPMVPYKELSPGTFQFSFSRKESDDSPMVIDQAGKLFEGRVMRDEAAQIAFELKPWLLKTGVFGISLRMLAVKVFGSAVTAEDVADLFGPSEPTPVKTETKKEVNLQDLF